MSDTQTIGKRGQNVRLAARLTGWDVDILTPVEFTKGLDIMATTLTSIDTIEEDKVDRLAALGIISVFDVEEVGVDYLQTSLEITPELAKEISEVAAAKAKIVGEQQLIEKEAAAKRKAQGGDVNADMSVPSEQQAAAVLGLIGGAPVAKSAPTPAAGGADASGSIVDMLTNRVSVAEPAQDQETKENEVAVEADVQSEAQAVTEEEVTSEVTQESVPSEQTPADTDQEDESQQTQ